MNRRDLLTRAAALMAASAATGVMVRPAAGQTLDYEDGLIDKLLKQGKTVLVDYSASWCSTCKAQERVMTRLRTENPAYDRAITFVRVDWDLYSDDPIATRYKVPRRSTLILLKGRRELGRIVAGTAKAQIKALLDKGLPTS